MQEKEAPNHAWGKRKEYSKKFSGLCALVFQLALVPSLTYSLRSVRLRRHWPAAILQARQPLSGSNTFEQFKRNY